MSHGHTLDVDVRARIIVAVSFISPGGDPQIESELARQRQHDVEAKAEQYTRLHADEDGPDTRPGAIRRALRRAWAALGRRG